MRRPGAVFVRRSGRPTGLAEQPANLEGEREPALALFDRAGKIASLLDIFKRKRR
ncbi:hypothetical protein [Streptacidiphilus sp. EB103A]|uniref:hypothetical protein n=1 Tax=Streptacidiphilus sp. EB103A TaxID=3156275 RepID=UPI0035192E63